MRYIAILIISALFVPSANGQSFRSVLRQNPQAKLAHLTQGSVAIFADPDTSSQRSWYGMAREVAVYGKQSRFWQVAAPDEGLIGYVREDDVEMTERRAAPYFLLQGDASARAAVRSGGSYKDPMIARLFSVILTGGGHIYAGEVRKGLLLMGIGGGATALGLSVTLDQNDDCHPSDCPGPTNFTPLYVGTAVGAAAWIYGIVDADNAVREYNQRLAVRPAYNQGTGLALRVGL